MIWHEEERIRESQRASDRFHKIGSKTMEGYKSQEDKFKLSPEMNGGPKMLRMGVSIIWESVESEMFGRASNFIPLTKNV